MSTFALSDLLKYPPEEAMFIAFNIISGTNLNPRYIMVSERTPSTTAKMRVKIKARECGEGEEVHAKGEGSILVNRLNLNDFFNGEVKVPFDGRITSMDVANIINQRTGIVFDSDDFIEEIIEEQGGTLKASPISLRWFGEVAVIKE